MDYAIGTVVRFEPPSMNIYGMKDEVLLTMKKGCTLFQSTLRFPKIFKEFWDLLKIDIWQTTDCSRLVRNLR